MKVILLQDIKALGKAGELVEVNDGYARNFLMPKKMAMEATKAAQNERNQRIEKEQKRLAEEKETAMQLYKELNNRQFELKVKCNDGKMYGSVTTLDIANLLKEANFVVDKKKITIHTPIKALGSYPIDVWCYKETVAKINLNVVSI